MTNRSKQRGTKWESRLVDFLRQSGHPRAERRASNGVNDRGDVAGIDSWVIEAKSCKRVELGPWMDEAEREAKAAGVARWAVVFPRRSHSAAKAFAVVPLWLLAELMRDEDPQQGRSYDDDTAKGDGGSPRTWPADGAHGHDVGRCSSEPSPATARVGGDEGSNGRGRPLAPLPVSDLLAALEESIAAARASRPEAPSC